ncbi:hypothetical protein E3E35_10580 [Thermococcus sp. GR7]|nr:MULTISPECIES: hypothetical protein [unclassified Thermococcus]NJE06630.1 hypothetical protein [Thermococcus sp. M36]NJE47828.1 hypothetical protein [Thermococcus sp. GR7]NJE55654.1 hypothetical protein [Thermococcus sp. 21S9]
MRPWSVLAVLVLILGTAASAGCIRQEGGFIIIDFNNETISVPIPTNLTNVTNQTNSTEKLYTYDYELYGNQELVITDINYSITVDYDASKGKFFFITTDGVYWAPLNATIDNIHIYGVGVTVGLETPPLARVNITSTRELEIIIRDR